MSSRPWRRTAAAGLAVAAAVGVVALLRSRRRGGDNAPGLPAQGTTAEGREPRADGSAGNGHGDPADDQVGWINVGGHPATDPARGAARDRDAESPAAPDAVDDQAAAPA